MATYHWKASKSGSNEYVVARTDTDGTNVHDVFTLDVSGGLSIGTNTLGSSSLLLYNTSGDYVGLEAPTTCTASVRYSLPLADGTSGQVLSTDGLGALSWATDAGGGGGGYSYMLVYGRSAAKTNTTYEIGPANGAFGSEGYRLPRACDATALAVQAYCSVWSSTNTFSVELYKNGTATGESVTSDSVTSVNAPYGGHGTITSTSFAVGDRASVFVTVPSNFTIRDVTVSVVFEVS